MKKIFFILAAFNLLGCNNEEILDSTPYGQSTSADFWRNGEDAVAAANAMYEVLRNHDLYGHSEHTFDIPSDDQYRAGDHGEDQAIEEFTFDADNAQLGFGWKPKYEIVSRANAVLINVPEIDMEQSLKDQVLGEAHFMRGFAFWRLGVIYGGIPLILEEDVLSNEFNKPRASLEETYDQIQSDWETAAAMLPLQYDASEAGRPTKGTVWGFLAKLNLYRENFTQTIDYGTQAIDGPYTLAEDYGNNFRIESENNPEMLFSVQALDGWGGTAHRIYSTPRPWGGWDFHEPVQNLVDEFEEGDPRLDYTLFTPGEMVDLGGDRGMTEYTEDLSLTGYHFQKFASWRPSGGLDDGQNIPILRLSDVYLLVAEAKIRSGQSGDAEINAVRRRAGLEPITNASMQDLIHERRVELAGENQRHQDLMRWDKANIVDIVSIYAEDRGPYDPVRNFQRPKHYYFAIPQREIDLSNGVLEQNTGY